MEKNEIKPNLYCYEDSSEMYTIDREKIAEVLYYPKIPEYLDKFESEFERKCRIWEQKKELCTFVDNYLLSLFGVNITAKKRNHCFLENILVDMQFLSKRDFEFEEIIPKTPLVYSINEITQKLNDANLPLKAQDLVSVNTAELIIRIEQSGSKPISDARIDYLQRKSKVKLYAAENRQGIIYYTFTKISNSENNIKYRLDRKINYFPDD